MLNGMVSVVWNSIFIPCCLSMKSRAMFHCGRNFRSGCVDPVTGKASLEGRSLTYIESKAFLAPHLNVFCFVCPRSTDVFPRSGFPHVTLVLGTCVVRRTFSLNGSFTYHVRGYACRSVRSEAAEGFPVDLTKTKWEHPVSRIVPLFETPQQTTMGPQQKRIIQSNEVPLRINVSVKIFHLDQQ